jgi:hypothetical protein
MEQPKDYEEVVELFEEQIAKEYAKLPFWLKIVVQLQNHVLLSMFFAMVVGYLVGVNLR